MKRYRLAAAMVLAMSTAARAAAAAPAPATAPAAGTQVETWGKTNDGQSVQRFTLRNSHGMVLRVMTLGATITSLEVPDNKGVPADVVIGADSFDRYRRGFPTPAAVMGRVANRIAGAAFTLDGVDYHLAKNNGPNTIHGGWRGFGAVVWEGQIVTPAAGSADVAAVKFTYHSKDLEEGYPGDMTASVTFTLTDNNEMRLDYQATTDKPTLVNLTSHAYYNLGGVGSGSILDEVLWIDADRYTVADAGLVPTGEILPVKGTPLDFTTPAVIGSRLAALRPMITYDQNYVLNGKDAASAGTLRLAARVHDPRTGRTLEVRTDQPGLQLYTGDARHPGLCLEPQHFPDAVHHANFPSTLLKPGETFRSTSVYTFSTEPPAARL